MSPARLLPRLVLDRRLATVLLALAASLLPVALVAAATSPLGFTLGQTTLAEVERSVPPDKIKQRAGRTLLDVDPAAFDFDGLEQVHLVFDADQHLAMVLLTIAKRRFPDVVADLRAKYSVDRDRINNFMRNGEALFRSGDDWIYLNAPHLSFSIELTYAIDAWWREMIRDIEEDQARKRQQERGKL
ncbi:MAG: hypothetical protein AB7I59_01900 [Geminicoccaceae bacterium]